MNFALSDEQRQLQEHLRTLASEQSDALKVHKLIDDGRDMSDDLWRHIVDFGLPGMIVPEEHGGLGLEIVDLALAAEVLGEFAAPCPFLPHVLATLALLLGGSAAQKRAWLPRLASGELVATVAFSEGRNSWLPSQWGITIEHGRIRGEKHFVMAPSRTRLAVVGLSGGRLGLVELDGATECRPVDAVDRTRPLRSLRFDAAAVELLPDGERAAPRVIDAAAVLLAADSFGGASRCLRSSVDYAMCREQFGVTIAHFQALRHQLANMALTLEPLRGLYWYAAHACDRLPKKASHAAALAKAQLADCFLQTARATVEVHGGIGFTWEHDAHIWLKRAMLNWSWLGQPRLHRLRAAELAGWA